MKSSNMTFCSSIKALFLTFLQRKDVLEACRAVEALLKEKILSLQGKRRKLQYIIFQ